MLTNEELKERLRIFVLANGNYVEGESHWSHPFPLVIETLLRYYEFEYTKEHVEYIATQLSLGFLKGTDHEKVTTPTHPD